MTYRSYCSLLAILAMVMCLGGLSHAGPITNGSFESGDLTGWDDSGGNGSVQVLVAGDILPAGSGIAATDGDWFAMVGNGPADVGNDGLPDTGVLVSDPFTVGAFDGTLSFDYQFFTFEFTGDIYADYYEIWLHPTAGPSLLLDTDDTTNTNFTYMGDIYDTPDGTGFWEQQPMISYSTPIAAGDYTLEFLVMDDFDGSFDSVLFVDNVLLVDNLPPSVPPIPEPGTAALVGFAGALLAWRLRKRRSA